VWNSTRRLCIGTYSKTSSLGLSGRENPHALPISQASVAYYMALEQASMAGPTDNGAILDEENGCYCQTTNISYISFDSR